MAPPNSGPDPVRRTASQSSQPESLSSARTQTTNVFSDDYALDRSESGGVSPTESAQDTVNPTPAPRDTPVDPPTTTVPQSALPPHMASERPSSSVKRPLPPDTGSIFHRDSPSVAPSESDLGRSDSTSSQFAPGRPQSPYAGPTAPSQPYAMYPQVTRASSIASESTVRPVERPFVPQSGPEHPYSMYQNAVPEEEDDDDPSTTTPPLPFPGIANSFHAGSTSSGNDTGDIVGSDGHIEQLPPYTRYADNVVAKGDMAQINGPAPESTQGTSSQTDDSSLSPNTTSSETQLRPSVEAAGAERELARKEGLYERSKKRKCCGIPVIILVLLILIIVVSASIGGVVGGVVGNRKGVDHAKAFNSATTTVWLDADPVETGPSTPSCPTGHFTIPLSNIGQVQKCITDSKLNDGWDCMDTAQLGITVLEENGQGSGDRSITFDDYSEVPRLFRYGPQPPDFNGTKFLMQPVEDRDNRDFGVAMFFSHLFDKIVILPENMLSPGDFINKRSLRKARDSPYTDEYLNTGHKPWYCFWNQTVEEFWIFLEKDVPSSTVSAAAAMTSDISGYPRTASSSTSRSTTTATPSEQALDETLPQPTPSNWYGPKARRSKRSAFPSQETHPSFPKKIKMVEKRKPHDNIGPYCQQMQVLDNWQILPIPGVDIIDIDELQFDEYIEGGQRRRRSADAAIRDMSPVKRDEVDLIGDLESLCICEWRSG